MKLVLLPALALVIGLSPTIASSQDAKSVPAKPGSMQHGGTGMMDE